MKKDVIKFTAACCLLLAFLFLGWRGYSPVVCVFGWLCLPVSVALFYSLKGSNAISELAKEFFDEEN